MLLISVIFIILLLGVFFFKDNKKNVTNFDVDLSSEIHSRDSDLKLKYRFSRRKELESFLDKNQNKNQKNSILKKYDFMCFNCHSTDNLQIDHNIPLSYGYGLKNNAVVLCKNCNQIKKDTLPWDFYSTEKYLLLAQYNLILKEDFDPEKINKITQNLKSVKINKINEAINSGRNIKIIYFERNNKDLLENYFSGNVYPISVYKGKRFNLYSSANRYFLKAKIDGKEKDFLLNDIFILDEENSRET